MLKESAGEGSGELFESGQEVDKLNPEQERFAAFVLRAQEVHPEKDILSMIERDTSDEFRRFKIGNPQFGNAWRDFESTGWHVNEIKPVISYLKKLRVKKSEEYDELKNRLLS